MGQSVSVFTEQEISDYEDLTFFTKKEVVKIYQTFRSFAPDVIDQDKNARLPMEVILTYPALKVNPFGDRICTVFSSTKDGDCTFEDFLDLMSAFNEETPVSVKAEYAFRIFDFDEDDMLGPEDLEEVIRRLLGDEELPSDSIQQFILELNSEGDLDDDGMISFAEFEHVVAKSKEFETSFRIQILTDIL